MKKLAIIALLPCAMLISACSSMPNSNDYSGWNDFNFNNATVDSILIPGYPGYQQSSANYQTPKQYHVTQQDEQEYNAINNRVLQRQQQLQTSASTVNMSSSISTSTSSENNTTQTLTQQNMHY
jgi:hypothetical protein